MLIWVPAWQWELRGYLCTKCYHLSQMLAGEAAPCLRCLYFSQTNTLSLSSSWCYAALYFPNRRQHHSCNLASAHPQTRTSFFSIGFRVLVTLYNMVQACFHVTKLTLHYANNHSVQLLLGLILLELIYWNPTWMSITISLITAMQIGYPIDCLSIDTELKHPTVNCLSTQSA